MKTVLVANRKGGCGKTLAAVTIAAALAPKGRVALADADPQKSAWRWLKSRPPEASAIRGLDWTSRGEIGTAPKNLDWLVLDAPGGLAKDRSARLIAEADAILVPVLPSAFDVDSTKRFLREIEDIKRVRKGRVDVHLLANRVRSGARASDRLRRFFDTLDTRPIAWITDRAAYGELAEEGLSVFDRPQRSYAAMRAQWTPLIDALT